MKGLGRDSRKLESLVTKYDKIHDEGAGRRLLFTLKESGGLTDLRRRIGLHEQMLQIWYMTLVYGSLRRLEGGQENILRAIEAVKVWSPRKKQEVRKSLHKGDIKPLERELRKSGLGPSAVDAALGTAVDYVDASPHNQVRMESRARSSATIHSESGNFQSTSHSAYPQFSFGTSFDDAYPPLPGEPYVHRRKASNAHKSPRHEDWADDLTEDGFDHEPREVRGKSGHRSERRARERQMAEDLPRKERQYTSQRHDPVSLTADFGRPRSSSQNTKPVPPSPLLVVPDTAPRLRPASYHDPGDRYDRLSPDVGSRYEQEQFITVQRVPQRHRSLSRETHLANRDRRDHSIAFLY